MLMKRWCMNMWGQCSPRNEIFQTNPYLSDLVQCDKEWGSELEKKLCIKDFNVW